MVANLATVTPMLVSVLPGLTPDCPNPFLFVCSLEAGLPISKVVFGDGIEPSLTISCSKPLIQSPLTPYSSFPSNISCAEIKRSLSDWVADSLEHFPSPFAGSKALEVCDPHFQPL
jgi:hypothetical protein